MEYFFVLGRNPELSYAEVVSYLKARSIAYQTLVFEDNYLVLDITDEKFNFNIQDFGGIIKFGKVEYFGLIKDFEKYFDSYILEENKFSFSVFGQFSEDVTEVMMNKFKREKYKARVKTPNSKLKLQNGEELTIANADIEFFYFERNNSLQFGKVLQEYSYSEIKQRDMKKPFRRESLAISPRLAKILINLSQTKKGDLMLDCFCGVGGIIQEAVLQGINALGIDKDKFAIECAKKNMKWMEENYKFNANYNFILGDSATVDLKRDLKVDGVVSEPALGDLHKRRLRDSESKEYIKKFEDGIIPVLKRIKQIKKENAKIVLTLPFIEKHKVHLEYICNRTDLQVYELEEIKFPIEESREDQFVSREIVILY